MSRLLNDFHLSTTRPPTFWEIKRYTPRVFELEPFGPPSFGTQNFNALPVFCSWKETDAPRENVLHVVTV